jgi:hypothetical protein
MITQVQTPVQSYGEARALAGIERATESSASAKAFAEVNESERADTSLCKKQMMRPRA